MVGRNYFLIFVLFITIGNGFEISNEYNNVLFGTKNQYDQFTTVGMKFKFDEGYDVVNGYLVSRHGARYPGKGTVNRMRELKQFLMSKNSRHHMYVEPSKYKIRGDYSQLAQVGFKDQSRFGSRMGKI